MFTTRPELRGTFGMVASTHWLASAAGMAMLERGGNAFDAAAAAGFVLQVVEPHQNGPGGDMPVVFWSAKEKAPKVLCAQGRAPAAATIARYKDFGLDLIPGTGLLSAVVPGAVGGWLTLLRDHGTMKLSDILEPAIGYASGGYPVVPVLSAYIANVAELFREAWPTSAAVYLASGGPPATGSRFRNEALGDFYRRLAREAEAAGGTREAQYEAAHDAFYKGFVAETIDRFCRETEWLDSTGEKHGGLLTADDMAAWRPHYEDPLTLDYNGLTICKTGPWGQGPAALQTLALLEGFDLAGMDPVGPDFVHTMLECLKLAYADREAWYGDPDFIDVPIEALLSEAYADERRRLIGNDASLDLRPGAPEGRSPRLPETVDWAPPDGAAAAGVGEPGLAVAGPAAAGEVRSDTVHIDVIDKDGNAVSAMPSGGWMQSSPIIPELGFPLGSRAQMFWLEEGLPASLAPGKRPRTTLTPGLALRDGAPAMAFGSPGGDGQDQWALTFLLRHLHHGMNLQASIDAPQFLSFHWPNSFYPRTARPGLVQMEARFPADTIAELERRGHEIEITDDWSLSRLAAVAREPDGMLKAAANPRFMQGYAAGR
ncbi:MAG: gamma-glutamyltransferase family protein [Alphaproteobacteria bacterium]